MTEGRDDAALDLIEQRVAVVGGSGRMGLAVARLASGRGARVVLVGRSVERLDEAAAAVGGDVDARVADFADQGEAGRLLRVLAPLDHIVVTASGGGSVGSIPDTSAAAARAPFGRFWMSYHALHFAPEVVRPTGSVTVLSGSSSRRAAPGAGVWGTLHGSIEALARNAALELAPIRVSVVSPGGIGLRPDRQLAQHQGRPEDVAAMVLAMMVNPHVTDAVIDVDGGERLGSWSGR